MSVSRLIRGHYVYFWPIEVRFAIRVANLVRLFYNTYTQ